MTQALDHRRLANVLRGIEQPQAAFLANFRRSVDADVQLLLNAADSADFARVGRLVHRIEGAAKVIGAGPLAVACSAVEQARDPGALRSAVASFLACRDLLYAGIQALVEAEAVSADGAVGAQLCAGLVFLVVEDHEFQRRIIVRLLRQLGALEVHAFADGTSALVAALQLRSPAILVLDLAMPGLDGMEVMRMMGRQKLPLVVIVNSARTDDLLGWSVQTASSQGVTVLGAVSKPLTAAKLEPLLAQYRLERSQVDSQASASGSREHPATNTEPVREVPATGPRMN